MQRLPPRAAGLAFAGIGVVVLSLDGVLVRLVGAPAATLVFWRGLLLAAALFLFVFRRGPRTGIAALRRIGWTGVLAAVLFAGTNYFFVLALETTTVARTLVVLATGPIFAVLFVRWFLGERTGPGTLLSVAAAIAGVAIATGLSPAGGAGRGDLYALLAALSLAGQLAALRSVPERDMTASVALGGLVLAAAALPTLLLTREATLVVPAGGLPWLLLLGLVVLPVSFGLIAVGPRLAPAPEVNLLLLLETVLGPLWAWLALAEAPEARVFFGGAIVIAAVAFRAMDGRPPEKTRNGI